MNGISGFYGYPNPYQVMANPSGAALTELNSNFARDFGLNTPPVYNLPIDVNMGFGMPQMGGMAGGAYMNPYMMNGMGGMGGMMNPYRMMSPRYLEYMNMDYKERLAYDLDLRNAARENQYVEGKSAKNYAAANDGLVGAIKAGCNALQTVVIEGEADQIVNQFERIVGALKRSSLYERFKQEYQGDPVGLDMALRNAAFEQFQAATGQDLKAMIQENCDGAVSNGFWNTVTFGNSQSYSAEEIIARMEGSEPPKNVQRKKVMGKIGGVTATTLTGAAIGSIIPGIGTAIGAIVGAGVGLVAGTIGASC